MRIFADSESEAPPDRTYQMEDRNLLEHVQDVREISAALLRCCPHQAQVVQVTKPVPRKYNTVHQGRKKLA
jgi:hypothetical protein